MSNDETKPNEEGQSPSEEKSEEGGTETRAEEASDVGETESSNEESAQYEAEEESDDTSSDSEESNSPRAAAPNARPGGGGKILAFAAVSLLVGGAGGWFGREVARKQTVAKATDACDSWKTKVCGELGEKSPGCRDATAAKTLLPTAACVSALEEVQTTISSAKAARAVCDSLVTRLCGEIGPGTETCKMITDQTQTFPVAQCEQMTAQYDKVLEKVRQIAAQQEMMGAMRPGGGMPPGGMPPGMPPGAMPPRMSPHGPSSMPPGAAPQSAPPSGH